MVGSILSFSGVIVWETNSAGMSKGPIRKDGKKIYLQLGPKSFGVDDKVQWLAGVSSLRMKYQ